MARSTSRIGGTLRAAAIAAGTVAAVASFAHSNISAQEIRSPFGDGSDMGFAARPAAKRPPAGPPMPPMNSRSDEPRPGAPGNRVDAQQLSPTRFDPGIASPGTIESADLAPLDAATSSTPVEKEAGAGTRTTADASRIERLLSGLDLPPRSPALADLLRRQITSSSGFASRGAIQAVRVEALYRSGALEEATHLLANSGDDPVLQALSARVQIARGSTENGCAAARQASAALSSLPSHLAAEVIATQGYCAAASGNTAGASLFGALVRERDGASPVTLAILDALGAGHPPALAGAPRIAAIDDRLMRLAEGVDVAAILPRAEPALLAAMTTDPQLDPSLRISAAEAAADASVISSAMLAAAWRLAPAEAAISRDPTSRPNHPARRAILFRATESERTPGRKARLIRALLDELHRTGPYHAALSLLAPATESLSPVAEIGWFAETAVEILTGAARYDRARAWVRFAGTLDPRTDLSHWLALIDIAEATPAVRRGESLGSVEELALRGRFGADALHKLAAVLDALDYNVPVRLWEAASRTPQPTQGHLPETGVLAELQAASRSRDGLTATALAIRAIGPGRAADANILTLGDVIRALRRAGFETEARRFAYEALIPQWPRASSGG